MRYACLLRGINVSGQRPVAMAPLRAAIAARGFGNVGSYLQSGNLLLDADEDAGAVAAAVRDVLRSDFGHDDIDVHVLTHDALVGVIRDCPAGRDGSDTSKWHFTFLLQPSGRREPAPADAFLPERIFVGDGVVYAFCPNGYARTKIGNDAIERMLGVRATTRNWNTTTKLAELTA